MECGLVYATTSAPFELLPLQLLLLLLLPLPFDVIYQMQIWHACHILLNSIDFKSNWNENVSFLLNWFQRENFCQTNFTIEGCQTCVDTYIWQIAVYICMCQDFIDMCMYVCLCNFHKKYFFLVIYSANNTKGGDDEKTSIFAFCCQSNNIESKKETMWIYFLIWYFSTLF